MLVATAVKHTHTPDDTLLPVRECNKVVHKNSVCVFQTQMGACLQTEEEKEKF